MATWKLDKTHTKIQFKVRHLMVSNVVGEFTEFDGTVKSSKDDFSDAKIYFEADINSLTTGNEQRDGHLKSDDFFNAAVYPKLKFVSTEIHKTDEHHYKVNGDMTIRDKTLPITVDVTYNGRDSMGGNTAAGFEITGKFNRKDFGLRWNAPTEAGGLVVGEEAKIEITAELIQQA
jgi:polyisoprenoid-binding protein YceI